MPIDFVDQNFATEAFRRGEEAAQARLRTQLDEQRTRMEMDQARQENPLRLRSLQAATDLSETRADVERQRAPIDLESSRLANVQAGLNVQGSKMDGFLKSLEALENGDVDTAQKIASAMGETIPPEVLNNRTLVGQLKRLGTRAKEMFPNNPAKQQKWLVDATSQLKQGGVESAIDPTFPITVQTSVEPESATGGAQSSIGKIEADFKAGRIDQATRDAAIAKATQVGKAGGPAKLTVMEKKAIMDADGGVVAVENTISALKRALALSTGGLGDDGKPTNAGVNNNRFSRGYGRFQSALGYPDEADTNTTEMQNLLSRDAILQMSESLKGASTDRELAEFMQLSGASTEDPAARKKVIERSIATAERVLALKQAQADELRSGTYFNPRDAESGDGWGDFMQDDSGAIDADPNDDLSDARLAPDGFYYVERNGQLYRLEP